MGQIKIKNGLDIPISGFPDQNVIESKRVTKTAVIADDYVNMKPTMAVEEGDTVKKGQVLFTDKKNQKIKFTSPASGIVTGVNRGERRALISVEISISGTEEVVFPSFSEDQVKELAVEKIKEVLLESGEWVSLRERPFSKVANPDNEPAAIFVTAMDTNPLAPSIEKVLNGKEKEFKAGLTVLSKLTKGSLYLCKSPADNLSYPVISNLKVEDFSGPHPAGNAGTHIHFLEPVGKNKSVWYINAQDTAAIGSLFLTGKIYTERIISLAGPSVKNPRLIKTIVGAGIDELINGELNDSESRIISGSVLSGRKVEGKNSYLGRYHQSVSVLEEGTERSFLGWMNPGFDLYSVKNIVLSKLIPNKKFNFTTALNGGHRAIVPTDAYNKVMPLDIMAVNLLRSMCVNDIEEAEKLGILELDEEDVALLTFVCPAKNDYGPILRRNLNIIEKEG